VTWNNLGNLKKIDIKIFQRAITQQGQKTQTAIWYGNERSNQNPQFTRPFPIPWGFAHILKPVYTRTREAEKSGFSSSYEPLKFLKIPKIMN
jgi:hypothetical protein